MYKSVIKLMSKQLDLFLLLASSAEKTQILCFHNAQTSRCIKLLHFPQRKNHLRTHKWEL